MICQMRISNLPTCRTAMRRKTAARIMTGMYVDQGRKYRKIGVGICKRMNPPPLENDKDLLVTSGVPDHKPE